MNERTIERVRAAAEQISRQRAVEAGRRPGSGATIDWRTTFEAGYLAGWLAGYEAARLEAAL